MRLSVDKITEEFETFIKNKIKQKNGRVRVRIADIEDLDSILFLFDQAWHSTTMPYHPLSKKKIISKIFQNPNKQLLIAEFDSEDCGFAMIGELNDKIGEIPALGILPKYQHKGIGTLLGVASWDFFRERNVKELRCKVYKDNKVSQAFLKGIGFEEDLPEDTGLMHKKIPF